MVPRQHSRVRWVVVLVGANAELVDGDDDEGDGHDDDPDVAKHVDDDDEEDQLAGEVIRRDPVGQSVVIRRSGAVGGEGFELGRPVAADGHVPERRDVEHVRRRQDVVGDLESLAWKKKLLSGSP